MKNCPNDYLVFFWVTFYINIFYLKRQLFLKKKSFNIFQKLPYWVLFFNYFDKNLGMSILIRIKNFKITTFSFFIKNNTENENFFLKLFYSFDLMKILFPKKYFQW